MIHTRNQQRAQKAFEAVSARKTAPKKAEYLSFAKAFPTLLHTCGLAQAVAFAEAKGKHHKAVLEDVQAIMGEPSLPERSRTASLLDYLRLSREALAAATWVKRYAEALIKDDKPRKEGDDASTP